VAEAESKLSVHQSRLSSIEAKVVPEHLFFTMTWKLTFRKVCKTGNVLVKQSCILLL
jgi:hypothetical protein